MTAAEQLLAEHLAKLFQERLSLLHGTYDPRFWERAVPGVVALARAVIEAERDERQEPFDRTDAPSASGEPS